MILEPKKMKFDTVSTFSLSICHEVMGPDAMIFVLWMWVLSQLFHSPFTFIKRLVSSSSHFLPLKWYHLHIWDCWYFSWQSWFQLVIHPSQHFAWCTLHISYISRVTIYSLSHSFPNLKPVCCSMSSFNCCFLSCLQISQEAGNVIWYSHLIKNISQFVVIHSQRL